MQFTQPLTNLHKKFENFPYLDSLRGLAAIYVVIDHATWTLHPDNLNLPFYATGFYQIFVEAHYAVDLFIMLSGFCLMLPVIRNDGKLRGGIIVFFRKRARRILPPYYLAMGLSLLLIATVIGYKTGTFWDKTFPVTKTDILTHLTLTHHIFSDTSGKINYVFWSIGVEWGIYLLFPLILIAWRKFGALATTAVTSLLSFGLFLPLKFMHLDTSPWGICPHYFGLFTWGMLAVEIAFSKQVKFVKLRGKMPWMLISGVFAVIAIIAYNSIFHGSLWPLCDLVAGISIFSLLISLASNKKNWLHGILAWKPLIFLGTFAYSIYLIHAPLLQLIYQSFIKPLSLTSIVSIPIILCLILGIIISMAYLFFLACERPFINNKRA